MNDYAEKLEAYNRAQYAYIVAHEKADAALLAAVVAAKQVEAEIEKEITCSQCS